MNLLFFISLIWLVGMAISLITLRTDLYKANFFLALAFLSMAYVFVYLMKFYGHCIHELPILPHSQFIFLYLSGICIRLYTNIQLGHEILFRFRNSYHILFFLPGLLHFVNHSFAETACIVAGAVVFPVYMILSFRAATGYETKNGEHDRRMVLWLKKVSVIFALIGLSVLLPAANIRLTEMLGTILALVLCVLTGYLFLLYTHHAEYFHNAKNGPNRNGKYANSPLSDQQLTRYAGQVKHLLETQKCYLNPKLTQHELAKMIHISPHQLSQVLSQKMNDRFCNIVNRRRVEKAAELLCRPENNCYTVESIGQQCGFCNRVTFFNDFKKYKGVSPAEFRK
ncbi:MAG TPA: helix-turn-helix transcriptional regulator [Bacteroidales bacterium]